MRQKRQQPARARSPSAAASAARRARRPAGVSDSGTPAESSTATSQRASSAATRVGERAVGRDEGRSPAGLVRASRAARSRWRAPPRARPPPRSRRCLAAASREREPRRSARSSRPAIGRLGRPQAPRRERGCAPRALAGGCAEHRDVATRETAAMVVDEPPQHGLRMAVASDRSSSSRPPILRQLSSSRSVSRPGSTTAPLRQARDRRKERRGGRHGAGGACGDDRRVRALALQPLAPPPRSARCAARAGSLARARPESAANPRRRSARSRGVMLEILGIFALDGRRELVPGDSSVVKASISASRSPARFTASAGEAGTRNGTPGPSRSKVAVHLLPTSAGPGASGSAAAPAAGSAASRAAARFERRASSPRRVRTPPRRPRRAGRCAAGAAPVAPPRSRQKRDQRPRGPAGRQVDRDVGERRRVDRQRRRTEPAAEQRVDQVGRNGHAGRNREDAARALPLALIARWRRGTPPPRRSTSGFAHMQPLAVESQAVEPAGLAWRGRRGGWREGAVGRVAKQFGLHDRDARIDEGRDLAARRAAAGAPRASMAKSPWPS